MSSIRLLVTALLAWGALAAPAAQAESFKGSLSAAKPTFSWSGYGAGGPGFECSNEAEFQCDDVVLTLEAGGDLAIAIDVEGEQITNPSGQMPYPDLDLYLFKADPQGAKTGDAVAESATPIDDEKLEAPDLAAGQYVLEVRSSFSIGENYSGKAKLTGIALPPAPVVIAPAAPAPAAAAPAPKPAPARKKTSTRACRKKAAKIKNKRKRAAALKRCSRRR